MLLGVEGVLKLDVSSPVRTEKISISGSFENSQKIHDSGSLKKIRQPLRPTSSSIKALSKIRDELPDQKQIYGLTLNYSFKVEETKATIQVIAPGNIRVFSELTSQVISSILYENVYETQTWQLSDSNKRVIGYGVSQLHKHSIM